MNQKELAETRKQEHMSVYMHGVSSVFSAGLVERLLQSSPSMFLSDPDQDALKSFEQKFQDRLAMNACQLDEHVPYQIENAINKAYSFLHNFDCAINNIILPEINTNIIDCSVDFYNREFKSSFFGVFLFIKYELSLMLGLQKGGSIINVFHLREDQLQKDSHLTFTYLSALRGLTSSVAKTYRDDKIFVDSYMILNSRRIDSGADNVDAIEAIDLSAPEGAPTIPDFNAKIYETILGKVTNKNKKSGL